MSAYFRYADEKTGYELKPQNPQIKAVLKYIAEHLEENITIDDLTELTGYQYHYFCHKFKECTGFSPKYYITSRKLHRAIEYLHQGHTHTEVAIFCGYNNSAELSRAFKKHYNLTINEYLKIHANTGVEPSFRKIPARTIIGYRFEAPKDNSFRFLENGAYWNNQTFDPQLSDVYNAFNPVAHGECGLWVPSGYCENESPFYIYGVPVEYATIVPEGLTDVRINTTEYAIFKIESYSVFADLCENFRKMYDYTIKEWLPRSECYLDNSTPIIEFYIGNAAYLCLPVKR